MGIRNDELCSSQSAAFQVFTEGGLRFFTFTILNHETDNFANATSAFTGYLCLNSQMTLTLSSLVIFSCFELRHSTFLNSHSPCVATQLQPVIPLLILLLAAVSLIVFGSLFSWMDAPFS